MNSTYSKGIDFAIYFLRGFERSTSRVISRYVRSGMTVLDIGANIGAHTLILDKLVKPGGRVLAFEPTEYAFHKLLRNVQLNPCLEDTIKCFQCFLTYGLLRSTYPKSIYSNWPLSGGHDRHAEHLGEPMGTLGAWAAALDRVLADLYVDKVNLVKLDVDGFECNILEGAAEMLKRDRPILILELAPYVHRERGKSFENFIEILDTLGYGFYDQHTGKPLPRLARDIEAEIGPGSGKNVIARVSPD
jgi:FkbM family methyltransferase